MARKLTYEELEQRVKELEKESVERNRAEEALRTLQELARNVINSSLDMIITVDKDRCIVEFNKSAEKTFGYGREEVVGKLVDVLYADPQEGLAVHKKTVEQGQCVQEILNRRKNGEVFPSFLSASLLCDPHGEVVGVMGVSRDITEQKRAKEALQQQKEETQLIIDSVPALIFYKDTNDRFVLVNKPAADSFKMSKEEIIGKTTDDILPEQAEDMKRDDREVMESGQPKTNIVEPYKTPEGLRWAQTGKVPCRDKDGNVVGLIGVTIDITNRKLTEEALRESEEKYRNLVERADDGIAIIQDGRLEFVNKSLAEMLGDSIERVTGTPFTEYLHPDEVSKLVERYEQRMKGKAVPQRYEVKVRHRDDEYLDVEINAGIITYKGKPADLVFVRDITIRKQAEEALKESEERFRQLAENIREVFYVNDPKKTQMVYVSPTYEEIWGRTCESLYEQPMSFVDAIHHEDRERVMASFEKQRQGEPIEVEYRISRPDDSLRWIRSRAFPVKNELGELQRIVGIAENITERKHAEEALREGEERFREMATLLPTIISEVDMNARLTYVNEAAFDTFGYSQADFEAGLNVTDMIHPDDKERAIKNMMKVIQGEELGGKEYRMLRKDGSELTMFLLSRPMYEKGEIVGIRSTLTNITEKKKLEAQLQRAQTMETLGTLAGGVAHDLNNILSGLVSYPELLLLEIPEDSPLRNPILTIQKSGEKAAAVVQDLLTLARRGVAVTEVVNLNLIISEYVKSPEHEKLISFHPNVHVRTNLEADVLNILGSPAHLSKTVMNLVSNAAEAMPDGGKILISTENRYVDKLIRGYDHIEEGDYVILTVSDTGMGIIPEDMERIFEPFYTKKVMGRSGTGLGMAVVWGTVKDHRGYIDVESTEEKGTTFTLYFPVTRKEVDKDKALVSIDDYMGKGESILVVDDVEEQREIASKILKKLGYSFTTVSSGEEAVDYLKDNSADLLLLDMIMDPGMDGLDTYKQILELHPGQKAIITSGFSETKRVKEAQRLGAGAYVKKPFLLEKIGLAVKKELEK